MRLRRSGLGPGVGVRADADATKLQRFPAAQGILRRKTKKPVDTLRFIGFPVLYSAHKSLISKRLQA